MLNNVANSVIITTCFQLTMFLVSFYFQFDKLTDLSGTTNFIVLAVFFYLSTGTFYLRQTVVTAMVTVWAVRLGSFLLIRVMKRGRDARFDRIRAKFFRFLIFWIIQIIWVSVVSLPVTIINSAKNDSPMDNCDRLACFLWLVGFAVEVAADSLKSTSATDDGEFALKTGVWRWSRHPNYFGEILLWFAIFLLSLPVLKSNEASFGQYLLSAASPLLTFTLLCFISGIPMAEAKNNRRYKDSASYKHYKSTTSPLLPLPPSVYSRIPNPIRRIFLLELEMFSKSKEKI